MFPQTQGTSLTVGSISTMCCEVAGSTRLAQIQRASLDRLRLQVTVSNVTVTLAVWCGSHLLCPFCCLCLVSGVTASSHSLRFGKPYSLRKESNKQNDIITIKQIFYSFFLDKMLENLNHIKQIKDDVFKNKLI